VASIIGQHDAIKSSEIFKSIYSYFIYFLRVAFLSILFIYLLRVGFGVLSKALEKAYPYARNSLENRPIPPRKLPPAIHIVSPQQTATDRVRFSTTADSGSGPVRSRVSL
jgi:hypothetical protein